MAIVDRKKELIINAAGKNMSPANIEQKLKASSPLIGQAICVGDARPYNVALLVLDPDVGAQWAQQHGLPEGSAAVLAQDPGVHAEFPRCRNCQRAIVTRRADQAVHDPAGRLGARRRRTDTDHETQTQTNPRQVHRRDRRALRGLTAAQAELAARTRCSTN